MGKQRWEIHVTNKVILSESWKVGMGVRDLTEMTATEGVAIQSLKQVFSVLGSVLSNRAYVDK